MHSVTKNKEVLTKWVCRKPPAMLIRPHPHHVTDGLLLALLWVLPPCCGALGSWMALDHYSSCQKVPLLLYCQQWGSV